MKGIIITAKHHDGFCLWPSKYSTHTVRESPWKDGKGDVLKELSEACKEYGLKFGVYLSPWDQNHPDYGTPAYNQTFANTLNEVLSGYGEVFEQWFDGANGEGHKGKKQVYDWNLFHETVYRNQPDAIIFSDIGPGCRWMGNEQGVAGETNWSTLNVEGYSPPGHGAPPVQVLNTGVQNGEAWVPAETDVSIRPGWFYSPSTDDKVKSLEKLMDIYHTSVGRNSNLLLNVPADRRGRIHPTDSIRLMEFRAALDQSFKTNLAQGAITASSVRGNSDIYGAKNLLDGNYGSYWTTDDDIVTASFELELSDYQSLNRIVLQEYIPLGQRIAEFNIKYWNNETDTWNILTEATTIGYKRILSFPSVSTKKIKVNIIKSLACPILNNIEIYNVPDYSANATQEASSEGISTAKWSVISPKSGETSKIMDGQTDSFLLVDSKEAIVIDLGENIKFKGFFYIPEGQVTAANISRYNFYISNDNKDWTQIRSNAIFNNIRNNPIRQDVRFDKEADARFIKLEPLELSNDNNKYSIIELGLIK